MAKSDQNANTSLELTTRKATPTSKFKMSDRGSKNFRWGLVRGLSLSFKFLATLIKLCKISFLI